MATTSAGAISLDMVLNSSAFEKKVKQVMNNASKTAVKETKVIDSAFKISMGKVGGYIATAFSIATVYNFTKESVKYASEVQAAWSGLNSIVEGTGNSFAKAQKFLKEYTADGLVGISDAATAYKNLLARGYTTDQIEMTMERLKDAATFGRQASYSLSSAVVSATEGLKNENSVLVDNAGVTKNVAKMWEEYAESIGTTANNLTKQQKIQAEVLGIQEETKFQVGDSAAYLDTYAGKVAQLSSAFSDLRLAWGQVVTPILELFIPAITRAIQAMTAFINKIKQTLAVFGIEMKEYISKDNSISNVGEQATDTAENITSTGDAAKKAAKKIKNAFNSVDEINVLKTKDNAGSDDGTSGSSGAGSSNEEVPVVTPTIDTSNAEKVNSIFGKMFDFTNMIDSFKRLKEAAEPVISTISDGLKWAYDNVLVPFGKWTIEDALPAVLNLLAGALDVLNPLLESLGRVLKPVWDNALKPLLSWTGDAIVTILNGLADALSKIGTWMSENEKTVDAITKTVLAFFGAWQVTKLLAFIEMSGGLTAAIKTLIGGSVLGGAITKIKSFGETVALTVMYAGDFIKKLNLGAIAVKAWNVICSTAAIVAKGFGAAIAFITSPVGLVILGITALIAIIVLLVKNWDTVKEVGAKAWEGIKKAWSSAVSWFKGVVDGIKKAFSVIGSWFKTTFTNAWNNVKNSWSGAKTWASGVWSNIKSGFGNVADWFKTTFTKAWTNVKNVFSSGGKIFNGIKDGILNGLKAVINALISGINKVISIPFKGINTALNKIKKINILGKKPFNGLKTISVPQIPKLAEGGWFDANNPQLAIVGDNKREPEIVAPESKIEDAVIRGLSRAGNSATNSKLDITLKVQYPNGREIIKTINDFQIQQGKILLMT